MRSFIQRFSDKIIGVLSGFDRLVFRGTLRQLAFESGMFGFLSRKHVLLKDFGNYALNMTKRVKEASLRQAQENDRPVVYLSSSSTSKEDVAREIAERDGIDDGLIAVLSCVEPCMSYEVYRNRDIKRLELKARRRKCLHHYHYLIDPYFGFMNVRIQTWFPFSIQICINGREALSRQLDKAGSGYLRQKNCFLELDDVERAQRLMDRQLKLNWTRHLDRVARIANPDHGRMFRGDQLEYYWSAYQSEWASDIMFDSAASLKEIYPGLVHHAITVFSSASVMRFLGGKVHGSFKGEIVSDFKDRPEGIRVKHRVEGNSVKMYDKFGRHLRIETTINDPSRFKAYRAKEGEPDGPKDWLPMRKGIADLHRRAQVSQACNERYLDALSVADTSRRTAEFVSDISRSVSWKGQRTRGLRWDDSDIALLKAISKGEFAINGFRNRDIQAQLFDGKPKNSKERRRRSSRVTRLLRILRAHRLIKKVPRTHRYLLSPRGKRVCANVLEALSRTEKQLQEDIKSSSH